MPHGKIETPMTAKAILAGVLSTLSHIDRTGSDEADKCILEAEQAIRRARAALDR